MKRFLIGILLLTLLTGCTGQLPNPNQTEAPSSPETQPVVATDPPPTQPTEADPPATQPTETQPQPTETQPPETQPTETQPTETQPPPTQPVYSLPPVILPEITGDPGGKLVVIDAGHQRHGNYDKEPVGPGASEWKAKVSSGTQGCVTGLEEYAFNLSLSLLLRSQLEARGYRVMMIRTHHDVDYSNAYRAAIANEAGADIFIRIHANGSEDPSVRGALTMCQTPQNPYNAHLYTASRRLSQCVLDGMVNAAQCKRLSILETDTMSGINWCQVPVTIVEAGFMSCPEEDTLLATESYQKLLAKGIADGIDAYFSEN